MSDLAPVLQDFFTRRLVSQRDASPATITAYRDTFRLLLGFASARSGKAPSALSLADLDAPAITAFLQHLQDDRGNSVRTRNARLAAVHSLFAYAALRHPEHGALIQRVLAIPGKRRDRTDVTYLTQAEADALLAACDQSTRTGRRDHAMLALAVQAGLRVSELTSLTCADIRIQAGPHVHCTGKGRKERDTPLLPATVRIMKAWLAERGGQPGDPLFPGPSGQRLSRDAVERRVKLYHERASAGCPSLAAKHVTVHTLRHSAAMWLLLAGVDITVIALWLGHESLTSTQAYLHADMRQKQEAIGKTAPPGSRPKPALIEVLPRSSIFYSTCFVSAARRQSTSLPLPKEPLPRVHQPAWRRQSGFPRIKDTYFRNDWKPTNGQTVYIASYVTDALIPDVSELVLPSVLNQQGMDICPAHFSIPEP